MPKLTIVCAGKMKESYQKSAIDEYLKRLSKYFTCNSTGFITSLSLNLYVSVFAFLSQKANT